MKTITWPVTMVGLGLLLPVLLLLPFLGGFFFNAGSPYSDIAISHYPNAVWLQQSIRAGVTPLWSPGILSGTPLSANPLSGLHYPFGWIALLFPLPFGLNLTAVLHLVFAGLGMFWFLKSEGMHPAVALFGALGYEALPRLFAHFGAGHLTLVYAAAWGPWLLLAQQAANRDLRRFWMAPGLVLGVIFLADPRYAAIAGLLWAGYTVYLWFNGSEKVLRRKRWLAGLQVAGTAALALGVGAVLLIPMLEYVSVSTRGLMTVKDLQALSLPPLQILGLLVPNLSGTAEWMLYPGAGVVCLALLGLVLPGPSSQKWFWGMVVILSLVWSLGEYLPGLSLLNRLPGLNLLRVPPRMMLAGSIGLIVLACTGLQGILADPSSLRALPRANPLPLLVGLDFLLILLSGVIAVVNHEFPWRFLWGAAALTGTLVLLFITRAGRIRAGAFVWIITAWLLFDTAGVNYLGIDPRPAQNVLSEGGSIAETLVTEIPFDYFRVYSPSYSLPQQTAAFWRLELADGIDPLQLTSYSQFMGLATGVPVEGYSVTLPPFADGEPAEDNRSYLPDPKRLGLLNVRYVASEFPINVQGLDAIGKYGTVYLYKNEYEMPRAWIQDSTGLPGQGARGVNGLAISANRVEVSAEGPGLLVVAEIFYPGWQASLDGGAVEIQPVGGILRGVALPPGEHILRMEFKPLGFFFGLGISVATLLGCLAAFLIARRRPT